MTPLATTATFIFSLGVLVGDIFIVFAVLFLFSKKKGSVNIFFQRWGILLGFLISLGATFGSLFYSHVVGFEPCVLCWYQRIFLFPQTILFAIALWKKDRAIVKYSLGLSSIGAVIALYHYYGQMFNNSVLTCSATAVSCAQIPFVEFGYITIPMMGLTSFLLLILIAVYEKTSRHSHL